MEEYCFLNGQIIPLHEAKIGVDDIGILRGYGIYEGIPVVDGKPFRFADHWSRLLAGAHTLDLNVPVTEEKAEKVIKELYDKNLIGNSGEANARASAKMILTGGKSAGAMGYDFEVPTFFILVRKREPLPEELYANGAKLVTFNHKRELPEIKTTNYIRGVSLQEWKNGEGAADILYTYDGEVLECSTSNFFFIKDQTIITPDENVLKGITRKVLLELAQGKYQVEQRPVDVGELKAADEAFITSSFKDILPITQIDDIKIGNGVPGAVTHDLMAQFREYVAKY